LLKIASAGRENKGDHHIHSWARVPSAGAVGKGAVGKGEELRIANWGLEVTRVSNPCERRGKPKPQDPGFKAM
jgi:hypothetical protein